MAINTWNCKLDRKEVRWDSAEKTIYVDQVYIKSKCPVNLPYDTSPECIFVEGKTKLVAFKIHSRAAYDHSVRYYSPETKLKLIVKG